MKLLIGVWAATGALPKHSFRDVYIQLMDFTYPDIDPHGQVLHPGLEGWIMCHAKDWCQQKGGVHNMHPASWMLEAADRCICLSTVYTYSEQEELFILLCSKDYKKSRG